MKKYNAILVSFFGFLFFSMNLHSQENGSNFSFGVKAGVNLSTINSSNLPLEEFTKNRVGFHGGLVFEYRFNQLFAIASEVLYSQQGVKTEDTYINIEPPGELGIDYGDSSNVSNESIISSTGKYDYLNIPIVAKLYFYDGLYASAGPQLSILLSASDEISNTDYDVKESIDAVDFGLNFGLGYQTSVGLFVAANYYLGLNNVSAYNYDDLLGFNPKLHQGVWQFSVGYKF